MDKRCFLFPKLLASFLRASDPNVAARVFSFFQELGAHAITLHAFMGSDTVEPFLKDPAKGVFVLCKVSTHVPGSIEISKYFLAILDAGSPEE